MPGAKLDRFNDAVTMTALLLLSACAFVRLLALPPFEDEGTQLHWIRRAIEAREWLLPMHDGKPLEAWPMIPLVSLGWPPLVVMRALHVVAGMLGAVLLYRLALHVMTRGAAVVCSALFAICPFVVYLQRLALSDMFLCTAGIAVLLSVLRLLEAPTWRRTTVLATTLVIVAFCKLPVGFVFMICMPVAISLAPAEQRRQWIGRSRFLQLFAAHAPASLLLLGMAIAAVVQVHRGHAPNFGLEDLLGLGAGRYSNITADTGVARPRLLQELAAQLSWTVTGIGGVGVLASALLGDWRQRWLICVAAIPMLGIGLLAGFWFPRYLLFTLPALLVSAVCGWQTLAMRAGRLASSVRYGVVIICGVIMAHQSALIIWDPVLARWSPVDRFQYFEGWSSGYGYPQAAQFLLESSRPPSIVYSLDGHSAYQLQTYLPAQWIDRVKPISYGSHGEPLPTPEARLANILDTGSAWILVAEPLLQGYLNATFPQSFSKMVELHEIAAFDKPGARVRLAIYAVNRR